MSKNKNNRRGVKKRVFLAPMIGDPGPPKPEHVAEPMPAGLDLDSMNVRDLLQLALKVGINPKELCGIAKCAEHAKMKKLGDGFHNSKNFALYCIGIDVLWCDGCYSWWREKKPAELED